MAMSDARADSAAAKHETSNWSRILARYRNPSAGRSFVEILITFGPFVLLWAATWLGVYFGYWISLVLAVPAAGFLVRLFMIQHDCGHGSFFRTRWLNDWIGRVIGVLTLTPYDFWRHTHAVHHASSGNLSRRGIGDIDTLTVREYLALPWWGRLRYRLYRHPFVMFGLGPIYMFMLQHRLPVGLMRDGWRPWLSTMLTNLAIAIIAAVLIFFIGIKAFLLVHLPIMLLAGAAGVWLFYVQHQFEETMWADETSWNRQDAALHGSSHYDLPGILRWFTANIGVHHVHHLSSGIPFYRLRDVLRDHPDLGKVGRLTLLQSFGCVRLVLWDESSHRLVSFRQLRAIRAGT
jgi:omega-6 fatty acid desaturase (delta-12 desaturase)